MDSLRQAQLPPGTTMVGTEQGNFENSESLDRRKWHFQSLLFAICDYRNQNSGHGI
jgi:hypothetical protein